MMGLIKFTAITFLLLYVFKNANSQEFKIDDSKNIYNEENTKLFKNYLINSGQYQLALLEIERLIHFDKSNDTLKLELLQTYRKMDNPFVANELYNIFSNNIKPDFESLFSKEKVKILIDLKDYHALEKYVVNQDIFDNEYKNNMYLSSKLLQKNWKEAQLIVDNNNTIYHHSLQNIVNESKALKYKKPLLGGLFSAVIPGSGKFYAGAWQDGLISMVFVSANAFGTYRAFSAKGATFYSISLLTLGTGFYLGNVYGSYKAVKRSNQNKDVELYQSTLEKINTIY
jgi:TM2 domain-containing membrane protein YozV